jgi:hypothetical protein
MGLPGELSPGRLHIPDEAGDILPVDRNCQAEIPEKPVAAGATVEYPQTPRQEHSATKNHVNLIN